MAELDNQVTVNVQGMEGPVREIKAAVDNVAQTITANRRLGWLMFLLTIVNIVTTVFGEFADRHALEVLVTSVVLFAVFLLLGRRKNRIKEITE